MKSFKIIIKIIPFELIILTILVILRHICITSNNSILINYLQQSTPEVIDIKVQNTQITEVDIINNILKYIVEDKLEYARKSLRVDKSSIKVIVDIPEQHVYVKFRDNTYHMFTVSTGDPQKNYDMDEAVRLIIQKRDSNLAPIYGPRLLLMGRYRADGSYYATTLALHGTDTPDIIGEPKSLGCVYFRNEDILKIYPQLDVGNIVVTLRRE